MMPVIDRSQRHTSRIQALDRGLAIVALLAESEEPLTVGALARELGVSVSTVSRLAATLRDHGLVAQEGANGPYTLGLELLRYARTASRDHPLSVAAGPLVESLLHEVAETISLSVPVDSGVLFIRSLWPDTRVVQIRLQPGMVLPYHCTAAGKALLAAMPDEFVGNVIANGLAPRTPASLTNPGDLCAEIEAIRACGYAVDRGESDADVGCVAVAVLGHDEQPAGALSCSMTLRTLTPHRIEQVRARLTRAAGEVEAALGRQPHGSNGRRRDP